MCLLLEYIPDCAIRVCRGLTETWDCKRAAELLHVAVPVYLLMISTLLPDDQTLLLL